MLAVKAPAKINLFLEVTARRKDGFHELATIFARVGLYDTLEFAVSRRPGIRLRRAGGKTGCAAGDNIVYKAAKKFYAEFGLEPAVEITLRKEIPVGAGLGGGSSDAAAALAGLCRFHGLNRAAERRLPKLAAELGSDVPFFLLGAGAAAGTGRGEKLRPLKLAGRKPWVVLVYPGDPVFTKEAYGALQLAPSAEIKRRVRDFRKLSALLGAEGLTRSAAGLLFNRLEDPVLPAHPAVAAAKLALERAGADAALMSGSGATVFALCRGRKKAASVAARLACNKKYRVYAVKFC